MFDVAKLRTPPEHGDTLVTPEPHAWAAAAQANLASLRNARTPLLGSTLAEWRRRTRIAIAGGDDRFVIVTGHQPEFVHPGVWAKRVVAMRLAAALEGTAIDLVVDTDTAGPAELAVPTLHEGRVELETVRFADVPARHAFEQIPRRSTGELARFIRATREALGERYDASQMPVFFKGMESAAGARDGVDQIVAGCGALDASFGVVVPAHRVSTSWCTPLLADLLVNAPGFAACYNDALADYRRANRVRGARRPIPDLNHDENRCEVPLWAHRPDEPRRRVFVSRSGDSLHVFAGEAPIGTLSTAGIASSVDVAVEFGDPHGWQLRPRALALTIWARLLLADLFIHGIGGAKYDRISDTIMASYYGVVPPRIACISATLHLDLPVLPVTEKSVLRLRQSIRDLRWNPQRNIPPTPGLRPLFKGRAEAVRRAVELRGRRRRDHRARRQAFERIRDINAAILDTQEGTFAARQGELADALDHLRRNRISRGREYFFGLYDRPRLEQLIEALPAERDFRV